MTPATRTVDRNGIPRDRYGRPVVFTPSGKGKPGMVPYTRATTLAETLDDRFNLEKWKLRQVAVGLAARPDLLALVGASRDDKPALDRITQDALDASAAGAAANLGTALHAFTEQMDRGEELFGVPAALQPDLDAYREIMQAYTVTGIEEFVVCDEIQVAGTFDRIVKPKAGGKPLVADLKGLALDTPIPTPDGWTTMGEVQVGDRVFGSDGHPAFVTAKSETKQIGTYVVKFDDGEQIICDREHLWWTVSGSNTPREKVLGIEEIARTLFQYGQRQHRVPTAQPLVLRVTDLPIDPYLLGAWLGDGAVRGGLITKGRDLFEVLEADGHRLGVEQIQKTSDQCVSRTVLGLTTALGDAGLLHNKHIPAAYLRASYGQRLRLLQGLMDTDGTWNTARGRAVFNSTDKGLALDVEELCWTLGLVPHFAEIPTFGYGKHVISYAVEFHARDLTVFRLPRKAAKSVDRGRGARARNRLIRSVVRGPDVETACIAVDSPNRTYLCGRTMVPTHNTGQGAVTYGQTAIAIQLAVYAHGKKYDPATGKRTPLNVDQERAVVIHIPVGSGKATLYDVDIAAGWEAAQHAVWVRGWRKRSDLFTPTGAVEAIAGTDPVFDRIEAATTVPELEAVYREAVGSGIDPEYLIPACRERKAQITAAA